MEVAGEVEVDLLHRHDLGIAAAGRAALHAEARAERGLAQADHRLLADAVEAVAEADGGRGLALAGRRRVDRGDEDELAVGPGGEARDLVEVDLGDVLAVRLEGLVGNASLRRDRLDALHLGLPRDLDVAERFLSDPEPSRSPETCRLLEAAGLTMNVHHSRPCRAGLAHLGPRHYRAGDVASDLEQLPRGQSSDLSESVAA